MVTEDFNILNDKINDQISVSNDSNIAFKEIIEEVEDLIPKLQKITNKVDLLNEEKNEVISKIAGSADISKQIYNSSKEIQNASEEVAASASELNNLTNNIIDKIDIFKV